MSSYSKQARVRRGLHRGMGGYAKVVEGEGEHGVMMFGRRNTPELSSNEPRWDPTVLFVQSYGLLLVAVYLQRISLGLGLSSQSM